MWKTKINTRNYNSDGQSSEWFSSAKLSCSRVALKRCIKRHIIIIIIINFLPSVSYDPEGMTKIRSITKYYKISLNDLPPHQQSSHEAELH